VKTILESFTQLALELTHLKFVIIEIIQNPVLVRSIGNITRSSVHCFRDIQNIKLSLLSTVEAKSIHDVEVMIRNIPTSFQDEVSTVPLKQSSVVGKVDINIS
jgi:hypothetical protein